MTKTPDIPRCVVIGGGQHAKVVIDAMIAAGQASPHCVLDTDARLWGSDILSVPVCGGDEYLEELVRRGVTHFAVGVGSIGDATARQRAFESGVSAGLQPLILYHPAAFCSALARIGKGSQLMAGAVVNTSADVGENVLVNTGAIIEHDCIVGAHSHISTGARLAGGVRVGVGAHVGVGASVRQGIAIGDRAVVGAGAAVVRDVEANAIVVGVPASRMRRLSA